MGALLVENQVWYSPSLSTNMHIRIYGYSGVPFVVFPCSLGHYYDYENMGMVERLRDFLDAGIIRLYCVESVDAESWYRFSVPPAERDRRYQEYDAYIANELLPFIRRHCHNPAQRVMATGCSMGAYHALNLFLKHPDLFGGCIGLSGLYRLDHKEFGLTANDMGAVYFNSPIHYLAGMENAWYLDWYRKSEIILCVGQGAWEDETQDDARNMDQIFRDKKIPAWVDFWGYDVDHDWPWWFQQMRYFLGTLYREP